jgi:hypothetical protein
MASDVIRHFSSQSDGTTHQVVLRKVVKTIDPVTGLPSTIVQEETVTGLIVQFKNAKDDRREIDDTILQRQDLRLFIPAEDVTLFDIDNQVTVKIGSESYKVIRKLGETPAGSAIFHDVHIRNIS